MTSYGAKRGEGSESIDGNRSRKRSEELLESKEYTKRKKSLLKILYLGIHLSSSRNCRRPKRVDL